MKLEQLVEYLDAYLRVADVDDSATALNGLQVENTGSVERLAVAVDACQATIDAAVALEADLLLVHHGLFWGGLEPLTGRHWRRLRPLLNHDIALYSAHLPLDLHPEVGNNAVLARQLGVREIEWFGDYHGAALGAAGSLKLPRDELVERVRGVLGVDPHVIPAGPPQITRIGVITGGGGGMIRQAVDAKLDAFVTGEGQHHTHFDAEEYGITAVFAGHYATETVGVRALAAHVEQRFGLPWEFVDHPTGL
ncbi:MAG: Nif3-like dinuclear metal center hexameric protein [Gemmatimonadales bacterium]|jgi:dinuclear metal center YbgI/SA1388 family protein